MDKCFVSVGNPPFFPYDDALVVVVASLTQPEWKEMVQKRFFLCGRDPLTKAVTHTQRLFQHCQIKVNSRSSCCLSQYISRLPTKSFMNERVVSIFCLNLLQAFKGIAFALKYLVNLWSHESNRLGHSSCCQNLCLNFDCVSLCSYKFGDAE
jgi:hypothetical protein